MKKACICCKIKRICDTEKFYCPQCLEVYFKDKSFLKYVLDLEEAKRDLIEQVSFLLK